MPELSVLIPMLNPRDEVKCLDDLDRQSFSAFEILIQDEESATKGGTLVSNGQTSRNLCFWTIANALRKDNLNLISEILYDEAAVSGRTIHPRDDIFTRRFAGHCDFGDSARYVTRFWGCNMGVRMEVFDTLRGRNELIPSGHEEL